MILSYSHFRNCFETCSGPKSVASHPFKKDGVCNILRLRSARPTTGVGRPGFQKVLPHTIVTSSVLHVIHNNPPRRTC